MDAEDIVKKGRCIVIRRFVYAKKLVTCTVVFFLIFTSGDKNKK